MNTATDAWHNPDLGRDFACLVGEEHLYTIADHTTIMHLASSSTALAWMSHRPDLRHGTEEPHIWLSTIADAEPCPHCQPGDKPRWLSDAAGNAVIDWDAMRASAAEVFRPDDIAEMRAAGDFIRSVHGGVMHDRAKTLDQLAGTTPDD